LAGHSGESWRPVIVDDYRCLLYGPRLGRFYLVQRERASDRTFLDVIGLRGDPAAALPDPAGRIAHTSNDLRSGPPAGAPRALRLAYRALHLSRHVMPLRLAARLVHAIARQRSRPAPTPAADVARLATCVHAVEHAAGFADCYPRALVTAYLALTAGRRCVIVIGALAPTRKMHAWCSVDGVLPYEPTPEHYLYQPLWVSALSP
jgi:Transglutaminase-like superfamily